jgi:hypothetical protein
MTTAVLLSVGLFVGMLVLLEAGRRLGLKRSGVERETSHEGLVAIEAAVFGLLGLLIAFTFAAAATRFEQRRQGTIDEANAIGTAWLRLDLLPAATQPELRARMRAYADARLAAFQKLPDLDAAQRELDRAHVLQEEIWSRAVAAASQEGSSPSIALVLLPALNSMFDEMTHRVMAARVHTTPVILALLVVVALGCALLAGNGMAWSHGRHWIHRVCFAAATAATVYVIHDVDHPRIGLIRVDPVDSALEEVRAGMK